MNARIKKFLKLPVDSQAQWQGGVFDFGELLGSAMKGSPMSETKMALWVSCERGLVHALPSFDQSPLDQLITALLEFSDSNQFGYRPASICLTEPTLTSQLRELFKDSGTAVTFDPEPEFWCELKTDMVRHMRGAAEGPALVESDCSVSQIRAFAEAAAAFYHARPWLYLDDLDLLKFHTPKPPKYLKYATLLGSGGQEFGLGFYDSTKTHWAMRVQQLDLDRVELFSLTFNPLNKAISRDLAFWKEHNLPLETGDAFPHFFFVSSGHARAPSPKELEFVTIVLAALADTTEVEIDTGQWSKQVIIAGKTNHCEISIPDLLKPPTRKEWIKRGIFPESRGNEHHFRQVHDFIAQHEGMELEELNELLNRQFTGSLDEIQFPSQTPRDRAESLCDQAIEAHGRRRIQLARQALQEDSTHIESQVLLAESTHDPVARIEHFKKAVQIGEVLLADNLREDVGHFWGLLETRPYMRAKFGLAHALASNGQVNEAIDQMLDLLRLNPNDNQGVRDEVVPLMLTQNRDSEALAILNCYPEPTASWLYLHALLEFRRGGDVQTPRAAIASAFKCNRHVVDQLTSDKPPLEPDHYALGSPEEAAVVIGAQHEAWIETEGFIEWMFARHAAWERETSKRERDKKRNQRLKRPKPKKR